MVDGGHTLWSGSAQAHAREKTLMRELQRDIDTEAYACNDKEKSLRNTITVFSRSVVQDQATICK